MFCALGCQRPWRSNEYISQGKSFKKAEGGRIAMQKNNLLSNKMHTHTKKPFCVLQPWSAIIVGHSLNVIPVK